MEELRSRLSSKLLLETIRGGFGGERENHSLLKAQDHGQRWPVRKSRCADDQITLKIKDVWHPNALYKYNAVYLGKRKNY